MKKTMIIAIAMASITATAQTSAPAAAPVKKKAAVAAKKSTVKKAAAVQVAAVEPAPAAASTFQAAPAIEERKVASTDVQITPAAQGESTASVAAPAAAQKKWGAKVQLYSTTDATNTQNIQNLTTFSGSYKVLPKLTAKVGQTFETLTNGRDTSEETRELTKTNNFRTSYTDLGVATSLPGFAGSDELPLSVNFRVMGGTSEYTTTGAYSALYNLVDVNFSVPFTLSPKWSLSIDNQWRTSDFKEKANANRLISGPSLTYTINDYVSVYHSVSWIGSFKEAEQFRRNIERFYMETGVSITPVKNLSMTFMVDQDKAIYASPTSGVDVTNYSLYKPTESANGADATLDAVAYEAVIAYTF